MPIALLMEESTLLMRFGAKQLSPWVQLVTIEEVLIDRARSAFLVRWFGTHLPLRGSYLKIVIDNVIELRNRYLLAVASAKSEETGYNLTEPLASLAGELVGMLSSPPGAVAVGTLLLKKWKTAAKKLLGVVIAIGVGLLAGPLIIGLGIPVGFIGGLWVGTTNDDARAIVAFLGVLAKFLDALTVFLRQLLGPRDQIKNPIVKAVMTLFDSLAGLYIQFLGFLSYAVVELGPYLHQLAVVATMLPAVIGNAVETLVFILGDISKTIKDLFDPKKDLTFVIRFVLEQIPILFTAISISFDEFFDHIVPTLKGIGERFEPTFSAYFKTLTDELAAAIKKEPLLGLFDVLDKALDLAGYALTFNDLNIHVHLKTNWPLPDIDFDITKDLASSSSPTPPKPSTFPKFPKISGADFRGPADIIKIIGPPPDLADIKKLAQEDMGPSFPTFGMPLYGAPLALKPETLKAIDRMRNPPSVFAGEEAALTKELGKAPQEAYKDSLGAQQKLRDLLTVVVGRILPPALRIYMGSVLGGFESLDESLELDPEKRKANEKKKKGRKKDYEPSYPVRDLPDNGQLRPVVHRLVIESGATKLTTEDFEDRLEKALKKQSYPAPSGLF